MELACRKCAHSPRSLRIAGIVVTSAISFGVGLSTWTLLRSEDGLTWGTYLHGVFDAPVFRRRILNGLRARRGWAPLPVAPAHPMVETLDVLASKEEASVPPFVDELILGNRTERNPAKYKWPGVERDTLLPVLALFPNKQYGADLLEAPSGYADGCEERIGPRVPISRLEENTWAL